MKLFKNVFLLLGVFVFVFGFYSNAGAADTISSSVYLDTNYNGTVDTIRLTMDETVTACTYDAADWAVTVAGTINVTAISGITCAGDDAIIDVSITAGAGLTGGVTAPTITYANVGTAGSVTLTSGVLTAKTSSPTDGASPQIKTFSYQDTDIDGKIDSMIATYTEQVTAASVLGANDLNLTSVGDFTGAAFGALATDLITGSVTTTTIPFGTEATVKDTANAGTLSISTQNLFSLTDGTNTNTTLGAQTQATFADLAKPQIKTITYQDADGDSKMDRLDVAYTEPLQAGSVLGANDLIFTSVGDFTGAEIGALATDLITTAGVVSTWVPLGTEATGVDTWDGSGNLAVSSQNLFSLLDASGNNNTTLGAQATNATIVDGIKPIVTSTTPVDESTSQSKSASLVVVFSEPIATGSLTFGMSPSNVSHTPVWSVSNTTLTLSHLNYAGSTAYTATLTGLTDVATNLLLGNPYSWNFTTATGTSGGSSSSSGSNSSSTINYSKKTTIPTIPIVVAPGCSEGNLFNTSTGQPCGGTLENPGCSAGNLFNTITGAPCGGTVVTPGVKTYNFGTAVLKNGSQGAAVMELQRFLNDKLNLGLIVDGKLGPKTIAVIKKWQKDNGLVSDGLIGSMTKAKMLQSVK